MKVPKITIITLFSILTMNAQESKNPFLSKYTTPYGVPPFNEIKNEHFQPAIEQGIQEHESEIVKIANNLAFPTFENTILATENSGEILNRVTTVLNNLNSANTNDDLQKTAKNVAPNLASHHDNIYLNEKLFERIETIWNQKESLNLNLEQAKLLENTYKAFVRSGANLNESQKERLQINFQKTAFSAYICSVWRMVCQREVPTRTADYAISVLC